VSAVGYHIHQDGGKEVNNMAVMFTGHRQINGKYHLTIINNEIYADPQWSKVRTVTKALIKHLHTKYGHEEFVCGGAIGYDTVAALSVLELKTEGVPIKLILGLPFKGFESMWPKFSRDELNFTIAGADKVHYVCDPGYQPVKMMIRNKWMVDYPGVKTGVALYLPDKTGGTLNCISYIMKQKKSLITIHPLTLAVSGIVYKNEINGYREEVI
jgi:uncharacterized phage-like protein YoqJ